jgi:hypothetical protein
MKSTQVAINEISHMVVVAEGRHHHVGGRPKAAPLIDWATCVDFNAC